MGYDLKDLARDLLKVALFALLHEVSRRIGLLLTGGDKPKDPPTE